MPDLPDSSSPIPPPMRGGGCLIAAGLVFGPIIGLLFGQTSAGLVIGGLVGVVAAVVLTIADRSR